VRFGAASNLFVGRRPVGETAAASTQSPVLAVMTIVARTISPAPGSERRLRLLPLRCCLCVGHPSSPPCDCCAGSTTSGHRTHPTFQSKLTMSSDRANVLGSDHDYRTIAETVLVAVIQLLGRTFRRATLFSAFATRTSNQELRPHRSHLLANQQTCCGEVRCDQCGRSVYGLCRGSYLSGPQASRPSAQRSSRFSATSTTLCRSLAYGPQLIPETCVPHILSVHAVRVAAFW